MSPVNKRSLQLDFLRGVAILLVFGRHLELPRAGGLVGAFSEAWFRIGWVGVDLFFVLSGFLIGGLLLTELQQHGRIDVARFLVRRGLKIYPAYVCFISYLMLMPTAKAIVRGGDTWTTFVAQWDIHWPNFLFLQNYLWSPAGHTWTLAVEEHFYILLPFAMLALATAGRIRLLVPLCFASVPLFFALRSFSVWAGDGFSVTMSATHLRLDALLFGVGVRGVAQYLPQRFAAARSWRRVLALIGVLLWLPLCFIDPKSTFVRTIGLTATYMGSAAFLVAVYHTRRTDFGRWVPWVSPLTSLVAWIGLYSYAIYLWHVSVIGILEREIGFRILAWAREAPQLAWLASALAICAGAALIGMVASKMVEWPILRLRDRLYPSRSVIVPVESLSREPREKFVWPASGEGHLLLSTPLASGKRKEGGMPSARAKSAVHEG